MAPCGENVLGCVQDGHVEIQSKLLYINTPLQNGDVEECEDGVEKKGMTANLRV